MEIEQHIPKFKKWVREEITCKIWEEQKQLGEV